MSSSSAASIGQPPPPPPAPPPEEGASRRCLAAWLGFASLSCAVGFGIDSVLLYVGRCDDVQRRSASTRSCGTRAPARSSAFPPSARASSTSRRATANRWVKLLVPSRSLGLAAAATAGDGVPALPRIRWELPLRARCCLLCLASSGAVALIALACVSA